MEAIKLEDVQEVLKMLDDLKKKIETNLVPDGTCPFDVGRIRNMLQLADSFLDDALNASKIK